MLLQSVVTIVLPSGDQLERRRLIDVPMWVQRLEPALQLHSQTGTAQRQRARSPMPREIHAEG
jgi:hypothetical protein